MQLKVAHIRRIDLKTTCQHLSDEFQSYGWRTDCKSYSHPRGSTRLKSDIINLSVKRAKVIRVGRRRELSARASSAETKGQRKSRKSKRLRGYLAQKYYRGSRGDSKQPGWVRPKKATLCSRPSRAAACRLPTRGMMPIGSFQDAQLVSRGHVLSCILDDVGMFSEVK